MDHAVEGLQDADALACPTPPSMTRRSKGDFRMNRRALRPLLASLLAAGAISVIDASTARFWQVSTQADLLKGQVERLSIDYDGRLVLGPVHPVGVRAGVAVHLVPGAWPRRLRLRRRRQRRAGVAHRPGRQEPRRVRRRRNSRCTRSPRRPTGRCSWRTSPDGKVYRVAASGAVDGLLRSGGQVHLGARARRAGPRLRRHRRQGRHLPRRRRRQERGLLPDRRPPT